MGGLKYNPIENTLDMAGISQGKADNRYLKLDQTTPQIITGDIFASNLSGTNTGDQDLSGCVPYTGSTANVDLGSNNLTANGLISENDVKAERFLVISDYWDNKKLRLGALSGGGANPLTGYVFDVDYPKEGGYRAFTATDGFGYGAAFQVFGDHAYNYKGSMFFDYGSYYTNLNNTEYAVWRHLTTGPTVNNVLKLNADNNVEVFNDLIVGDDILIKDNNKVIFGDGGDSSIYYTGTNMIINPKEVGSGYLDILGDVQATNLSGNNTGDQDLSGYMLLDQTTPQTITATDTTITASDEIYYGDSTDSFKIKKDTVQGIIDLVDEQPSARQGRLSLPQLAGSAYLVEEVPGWAFSGQTNSIQAVSAWLVPIYVSRSVSYRGFKYYIYSTTGKTADSYRLGIYDVDYSTGLPKNLVWDSSKQTFGTTTGSHQVIGLNIVLTEGWYYIVGTKNGNINLYGSSPAQQRPPLGGFGDPITKQTLASTTADWTDGFPNPWVNTDFSHLNTNGYEASFFKLYRTSEA